MSSWNIWFRWFEATDSIFFHCYMDIGHSVCAEPPCREHLVYFVWVYLMCQWKPGKLELVFHILLAQMSTESQQSPINIAEHTQNSLVWITWRFLVMSVWKRLSKRSQPMVLIAVMIIYFCVMSLQLADTSKQRRSAARGQAKIVPVSFSSSATDNLQIIYLQKSANESILITEFNRRKKLIKDTCEKFGAYTTR